LGIFASQGQGSELGTWGNLVADSLRQHPDITEQVVCRVAILT